MRFEAGAIGLELSIPSSVYSPSDDTELLAESAIEKAQPGSSILEIGTGSGAVILSLAKSGKRFKELVAVDSEPAAVEAAKTNAKKNKIESVRFLQSDLFAALPARSLFDLILFNPPYLPTAKLDKVKGSLNSALDGGPDGLKVVRRFLVKAGRHLAPNGKILLVISSLQPKDKLEALLSRHGFSHHPLSSKSFFFERLEVWELSVKS
ncbi:MAG: methyltransferase [Candidatus Marsarchaeota archaeon]|nr:methyltransferase [Candidatus Marsarchaeota archaeon]